MKRRLVISLFALMLVSVTVVAGAAAQESATAPPLRDPVSLAQRFLGYARDEAFAAPTPIYVVGDVETFWVPRRGMTEPQQITARLVAVAPAVNVWVEEGVSLGGTGTPQEGEETRTAEQLDSAMVELGGQLSQIFDLMRLRSNFGEPGTAVAEGETLLPEDFLSIPDVDGDPRMTILYASDLPFEQTALYNPVDSIPAELVVGGRSNQRELILVNTSIFTTEPLDSSVYVSAVVEAYLSMVARYNYPGQPVWLQQLVADLVIQQLEGAEVPLPDIVAYLLAPDTPLLARQTFINRQRVNGAQQLFINYLFQEYGTRPLLSLFRAQGTGFAAVDSALRENGVVDPVTGEPVTARALFADFVMANALNSPFGDNRYAYSVIQFPQNVRARLTPLQELGDTTIANRTLNQFGSYYLLLTNTDEETRVVNLDFAGVPTTARLPIGEQRAPDDNYYWSGSASNANPRMTTRLDLRAVLSATLTFDAWYSLPRGVDFAYASVSEDEGATWTALLVDGSSDDNRLGAAVAPGWTGVSSLEAPRPFPLLGVAMGVDGVTINAVSPDGPAETAGLQAGDIILGYDGREWDTVPNIVAVLADYAPGDTISLMIGRGEGDAAARFDLTVELGTFPTRIVEPAAEWQSQSIDLSAYAGKEILLRFETVTLPGFENSGLAVDNIQVREINFADGGDSTTAWTLEGFTAVPSAVPQPFIVQTFVAPAGDSAPSVQALIAPDDPATTGQWSYRLTPNQQMIIAISAASDETLVPATFTLSVDVTEPDA